MMLKNILEYWKLIAGVITGTAAVAVLVWGLAIKHAEKKITGDIQKTNVEVQLNSLNEKFETILIDVKQVKDTVSMLSAASRRQDRSINSLVLSNQNLKKYMIDNAATKDDIIDILNIWDVKKNETLSLFDKP